LLNATVEAIDTNWSCIAMRCVLNARLVDRNQWQSNVFTQGWNKGRT
jgi:hypothetical protein